MNKPNLSTFCKYTHPVLKTIEEEKIRIKRKESNAYVLESHMRKLQPLLCKAYSIDIHLNTFSRTFGGYVTLYFYRSDNASRDRDIFIAELADLLELPADHPINKRVDVGEASATLWIYGLEFKVYVWGTVNCKVERYTETVERTRVTC